MDERKEKNPFVEFKQALDSFGMIFKEVLTELLDANSRLESAERDIVVLSERLDKAELRAGIAATEKIAEDSFSGNGRNQPCNPILDTIPETKEVKA